MGSIVMVVALFMVHFPKGFNPLTSGAELPLIYLSAFFVLMAHGAKKMSLEILLFKKEMF
jgi:uncharacterized membrane protein YphA (DoxX/SURF4 family)